MNKGFATILVLLVVVLVGGVGVGWYLSNTGIIPKFSGPATSEQPPSPPPVPGEPTTNETAQKNSPDGSYVVTEEAVGDHQIIAIKDKKSNIITDDLVAKNEKAIGYNVKFRCQCGTSFKAWVDNSHFTIKIVNGGSEEYEYLVDAKTGKVDETTFKRIK